MQTRQGFKVRNKRDPFVLKKKKKKKKKKTAQKKKTFLDFINKLTLENLNISLISKAR
jgi:hypothetical protein